MAYEYVSEDGKTKVRSEEQLTAAELDEAFGYSAATVDAQPSETAPGYKMEAARKGVAQTPGMIAGVLGAFGEAAGFAQGGPRPDIAKGYGEAEKAVTEPMMQAMGSTGAQPANVPEKIIAGGISAATDPFNYLMGVPKAVGGLLTRGVYNVTGNVAGGAGAEAGGEAGQITGERLGGETGGVVGRVLGSLGGGVGGTVAGTVPLRTTSTVKNSIAKFGPKGKELMLGLFKEIPEDEVLNQANRQVRQVFEAAAHADPNFVKTIEDAMRLQSSTNVKMPVGSLAANNPVIDAAIAAIAATDRNFRSNYLSQFNEAKSALQSKTNRMFGAPADSDARLAARAQEYNPREIAERAAVKKQAELESKAKEISGMVVPSDAADLGAKVVKLTEQSEDTARKATTPFYTEAFEIGKTKGVELPDTAVQDLWETVVGDQASDIFKTMPNIHGRVKRLFAPTPGTPAEKGRFKNTPATPASFQKASLEDLDSLKQAINAELRKTDDPKDVRLLSDLKAKLNTHINELDPDFVEAYKAADREYFKQVGLPFNAEAIQKINRAKFDENVVPLLTKNKSALSQFIDATGEDGARLAEDAFTTSLYNAAIKDGKLVPELANKWFQKNASALEVIPQVRDSLKVASGAVDELTTRAKTVDRNFQNYAKNQLLDIEGKNAQTLVNQMYGSKDYVEKFMKQHGGDKDKLHAIRSFLLDDIVKSPDPRATLTDRTKSGVYNRVFGPTYLKKISDYTDVAQRIVKDPSAVAPNLKLMPKDVLEDKTGSSFATWMSRLNSPVQGPFNALTYLASRFFNKQLHEKTQSEMAKVLLDPDAASSILKILAADVTKRADAEQAMNEVVKLGKKTGVDFVKLLSSEITSGAIRSRQGMMGEQQQEQETAQ